MTIRCPACRFENPDGFAFCGKCGARIAPPAPAALVTDADLARLAPYLPPGALDQLPPAPL